MSVYQDKIVWKTPVSEQVIEHHDGTYSMLCTWSGLEYDMQDQGTLNSRWGTFKNVLTILSEKYPDLMIENHLFRERDDKSIDQYIERHKKNVMRKWEIILPILEEVANNYRQYARTNSIALVVSIHPKKGFFKTKSLVEKDAIDRLFEFAREVKAQYSDFQIRNVETYGKFVCQSANRQRYCSNQLFSTDYRFPLNEQWVCTKPNLLEGGYIEIDGVITKVGLLYMHPDAEIEQFRLLASLRCDLHFIQVVFPVDTQKIIKDTDHKNTLKEANLKGQRGNREHSSAINSSDAFVDYVSQNKEQIFQHCWIVHIHGNPKLSIEKQKEEVSSFSKIIYDRLKVTRHKLNEKGECLFHYDLQMLYWRTGLIGHGYCSEYWRHDHTTHIANLAPNVTFNKGAKNAPSVRLGDNGQIVGIDRFGQSVAHSFCVAMTRGGKGTEKCVEILETYGRGINWLCIEYGGTYEFLVHGLKENYIRADMETSINPFPTKAEIDRCNDRQKKELRSITIEGLAFLLARKTTLNTAETAVAGITYDRLFDMSDTPLTIDFLNALKTVYGGLKTDSQKQACKAMTDELEDFLSTPAGEALNKPTTIDFDCGIVCIDFKNVAMASKVQAVYLLNYAAMRYMQVATMRKGDFSILFDEVHKFIDLSPEATSSALKLVARTGGKDRVWADIVTQGLTEIQQLDSEVLGSIPIQNLLYRQDQFDSISKRLNMPAHVAKFWSELEDPLNKSYRPHIKKYDGAWYSFTNTFPQMLLDIASTTGWELEIKNTIADQYQDKGMWVMLEKFQEEKTSLKASKEVSHD